MHEGWQTSGSMKKLDRLTALNVLLSMDEKGNDAMGMDEETQEAEPERKLADRTPAGRDAVDKTKEKETML